MFHKISRCSVLPEYKLHVYFQNGQERIYDMAPVIEKYRMFKPLLETPGYFKSFQVDHGGYGISWNDEIDISCDELYANGQPVITC